MKRLKMFVVLFTLTGTHRSAHRFEKVSRDIEASYKSESSKDAEVTTK